MEYEIGNSVFNDWKITRRIGNGASGVVYEIQKTDQDVMLTSALKIIHVPKDSSIVATLNNDGMDSETITSYLQDIVNELIDEIKIMVSMKGFPYIVNCEDYKVIKDPQSAQWDVLIRMELLKPLPEFLQENTLTEADALRMAIHLSKALTLFEAHGIIHRDIKPENIFVNQFGDFKVGDFGIARVYDKTSGELSKKGTENYMAPEVYRGQDYDNTVDIYSLGLVLYRLLNKNRLPFYPIDRTYTALERQQAMTNRMSGKKELPAPVLASPDFAQIILKMCAFRPEDRFRNASDLLRLLEKLDPPSKVISQKQEQQISTVPDKQKDSDEENLTSAVFSGKSKSFDTKSTFATYSGTEPSAEVQKKPEPKETIPKKAEKPVEKDTSSERPRTSRRSESPDTAAAKEPDHSRQADKKKKGILAITAFAILLAIVIPMILSKKYSLTVIGGSGSGEYKAGALVTVTAEEKSGSEFTGWKAEGITLSQNELSSETITIHIPRKSVALTATYTVSLYNVTINGGTGSGEYQLDEEVSIEADKPETGYAFSNWEINAGNPSISDRNAPKLTFKMKEENVELTAGYAAINYNVTVNNGTGSGDYHFGDMVSISAEPLKDGMTFSNWTIDKGSLNLSDLNMNNISFTMPAEELILTAHYMVQKYTLKVNNGKGSGMYDADATVEVTAEPKNAKGQKFHSWTLTGGNLDTANLDLTQPTLKFSMPKSNITLQANYSDENSSASANGYILTVNGGKGSGNYAPGKKVSIKHDKPQPGMEFSYWIAVGYPETLDWTKEELEITMPENNVIITAVFAQQ